jgi:hypothetical protein
VTWTNLLANKEAQKHKTSKKELDNVRALIVRDLADAGIAGLSADRRFATAYNAALQAANVAIACAGCRIVSKVGHPPGVVGEYETCDRQTHPQVRRLFRNLSAKAKWDPLHFLQRCHGDGSEGDPRPGIPFTENLRVNRQR